MVVTTILQKFFCHHCSEKAGRDAVWMGSRLGDDVFILAKDHHYTHRGGKQHRYEIVCRVCGLTTIVPLDSVV